MNSSYYYYYYYYYLQSNSRTERPRKTKIGTEVAHVTRDSGKRSKVNLLLMS